MKYVICILIVFMGTSLPAQINLDNRNVISSPCSFDPDIMINSYENWEIFQTEDDTWNGDRISNCINLRSKTFSSTTLWGVDLNTIDISKPLFVRFKTEKATNGILNIDPNTLNLIDAGITAFDNNLLNKTDTCTNQLCSGLITILEYAQGLESGRRRTDFSFKDSNWVDISTCFFSEKTALNRFRELIYKVSFVDHIDLEEVPIFSGVFIAANFEMPNMIDDGEIQVDFSIGNQDSILIGLNQISDGWSDHWVISHSTVGFPSFENPSITYLTPEPPSKTTKTINLIILEDEALHYQAHSYLKGGFLENSLDDHHELNIIDLSEGDCFFTIEKIFENKTNLVNLGGSYRFDSPTACFQFRDNAKLRIEDGGVLNFAPDAIGILNLRSGGTVELVENSTMNFNGLLMLNTYEAYDGPQDIYIEIPEGSAFIFGPQARVKNTFAPVKLHFIMKGGYLDMRHLSAESKSLIKLEYPEPTFTKDNTLCIAPNPMKHFLHLYFESEQSISKIAIFDLNGQVVKSFKCEEQDIKNHHLDVRDLNDGSYILSVHMNGEIHRKKFIVIN